jgi:glucosamine--fructose-6-phosphate aminotransferase (isomerizing)
MQRIGYRGAVARQPECLSDGLSSVGAVLPTLEVSRFAGRTLGLAGIGASYQAALAGSAYARTRGIRAFAYCPTDLYEPTEDGADAFIALSASGQSREITDVMRMRDRLPRVAICRDGSTPLATVTGAVIPTGSGADNGASSTGYTGTLLALGLLIDHIADGAPSPAWAALPRAVAETLVTAAAPASDAAARLSQRASIDIVGAGAGFATAGEAAMLIREAVRVPASGWDTLNYLHGPMESQDARTGLIALGEGREVKIAQDMAAIGCQSLLVTRRINVLPAQNLAVIAVPDLGNVLADAVLKIVAVQLVVGGMQDKAGLTDCTFRYRQTDTKLKPWSPTEL